MEESAIRKSSAKRAVSAGKAVNPGGDDLKREQTLAKKAARVAGDHFARALAARRISHRIEGGRQSSYPGGSRGQNRAIKKLLRDPFPEYGWLSEETVDNDARLKCRRVWIVDPLDGTKEFINGIPKKMLGCDCAGPGRRTDPQCYLQSRSKREMYWAARGAGCHLNTRRVRVTRTRKLQGATVLASRSETARGEWQVFHGMLKVSPTGSVAYKLAMVAAGKGDATFTRSPKSEWDIASGAALIMEAGGVITDIRGREIRFNQRNVKLEGLIADNRIFRTARWSRLRRIRGRSRGSGA